MAAVGVFAVIAQLPFPEDYGASNVAGVIIAGVWTLIMLCMGITAASAGSAEITIDGDGIKRKSKLVKSCLCWSEVEDWGLSYTGKSRFGERYYDLYFSKHVCPEKNECGKKLKGKMIRFIVNGSDYFRIVERVIPFCKDKTDVPPFVGEDRPHFLF